MEKLSKDFIGRGRIHGTYDHKNADVIYTFIYDYQRSDNELYGDIMQDLSGQPDQIGLTLMYNETLQVFQGFMTPSPDIWFTYGDSLFSDRGSLILNGAAQMNRGNELFVYNENDEGKYFDDYHNSEVEIIINDSAQASKVYDNVILNMNPDASSMLEAISLTTEVGTQTITVTGDNRLRYRELLHRFPLRGKADSKRVRGKWLKMKLKFNNTGGKDIRLSSIETKYRLSLRT